MLPHRRVKAPVRRVLLIFQQRTHLFCFGQIGSVETFGEPVVDWFQDGPAAGAVSPSLQQARETRCRSQVQRLGTPVARPASAEAFIE